MRWGSAVVLLALATPGVAWAGACCAGATSGVPVRVGECEKVVVGLGVGGETLIGTWDAAGNAAATSYEEQALIATVGVGARWARWGQAAVELPTRLGHRAAGDVEGIGGGPGDMRASATVQPFEERASVPGAPGWPRLLVVAGVRAPTGRDWQAAEAPLGADVTGLPGWGLLGAVAVERSLGRVPWSFTVDVDAPVAGEGVPLLVGAGGSLGAYLGPSWTLLANARHAASFVGDGTGRTTVGARVVHGRRLAWRAWAGVAVDPPLPWIGHGTLRTATVDAGFAWVR